MMMMMMMMNCFCGVIDERILCSLVSSRDHFQRSSLSLTSNMVQARFEPGQNLIWGFAKWCWAVVTTTTPLTTTPHSWICCIKLNNSNSRNWVCHTRRDNLINYLTSTFTYSLTNGRWKPFRYSRYVIQINIINIQDFFIFITARESFILKELYLRAVISENNFLCNRLISSNERCSIQIKLIK